MRCNAGGAEAGRRLWFVLSFLLLQIGSIALESLIQCTISLYLCNCRATRILCARTAAVGVVLLCRLPRRSEADKANGWTELRTFYTKTRALPSAVCDVQRKRMTIRQRGAGMGGGGKEQITAQAASAALAHRGRPTRGMCLRVRVECVL